MVTVSLITILALVVAFGCISCNGQKEMDSTEGDTADSIDAYLNRAPSVGQIYNQPFGEGSIETDSSITITGYYEMEYGEEFETDKEVIIDGAELVVSPGAQFKSNGLLRIYGGGWLALMPDSSVTINDAVVGQESNLNVVHDSELTVNGQLEINGSLTIGGGETTINGLVEVMDIGSVYCDGIVMLEGKAILSGTTNIGIDESEITIGEESEIITRVDSVVTLGRGASFQIGQGAEITCYGNVCVDKNPDLYNAIKEGGPILDKGFVQFLGIVSELTNEYDDSVKMSRKAIGVTNTRHHYDRDKYLSAGVNTLTPATPEDCLLQISLAGPNLSYSGTQRLPFPWHMIPSPIDVYSSYGEVSMYFKINSDYDLYAFTPDDDKKTDDVYGFIEEDVDKTYNSRSVGYGLLVVEKKEGDSYKQVFAESLYAKGIGKSEVGGRPVYKKVGLNAEPFPITGKEIQEGSTFRVILYYKTTHEGKALFWTTYHDYFHTEVAYLSFKDGNIEGAVTIGSEEDCDNIHTFDDGALISGPIRLLFNNKNINLSVRCDGKQVLDYKKSYNLLDEDNGITLTGLDGVVDIDIGLNDKKLHRSYYACSDYINHYHIPEIIKGTQQLSDRQMVSFIDEVVVNNPGCDSNHRPLTIRIDGNEIISSRYNEGVHDLSISLGDPNNGFYLSSNYQFIVEDVKKPSINRDNVLISSSIPTNAYAVRMPTLGPGTISVLFSSKDEAYDYSFSMSSERGYKAANMCWESIYKVRPDCIDATIDMNRITIKDGKALVQLMEDVYVYGTSLPNSNFEIMPIIGAVDHYYRYDGNTLHRNEMKDYMLIKDYMGWESDLATITDSSNTTYALEYGLPLIEQLEAMGTKGKFTINEWNINGGSTSYSAYYYG